MSNAADKSKSTKMGSLDGVLASDCHCETLLIQSYELGYVRI